MDLIFSPDILVFYKRMKLQTFIIVYALTGFLEWFFKMIEIFASFYKYITE